MLEWEAERFWWRMKRLWVDTGAEAAVMMRGVGRRVYQGPYLGSKTDTMTDQI